MKREREGGRGRWNKSPKNGNFRERGKPAVAGDEDILQTGREVCSVFDQRSRSLVCPCAVQRHARRLVYARAAAGVAGEGADGGHHRPFIDL